MFKHKPYIHGLLGLLAVISSCKVPALVEVNENRQTPQAFMVQGTDSISAAQYRVGKLFY